MKVFDEPTQHPAEFISLANQRLHCGCGDVSLAACTLQVADGFRERTFRDDQISCKGSVASLLESFFDVGRYGISGGRDLPTEFEFSAQRRSPHECRNCAAEGQGAPIHRYSETVRATPGKRRITHTDCNAPM